MVNALNLTGADMSAGDFDPIPSGTYPATVTRFEENFTKGGEDAKLPAGTAMFNVGFCINEGTTDKEGNNVGGRWVWRNYIVAPAKVDGKPYEHKKRMDGQLARFFTAVGYTDEQVTSGDFAVDADDIVGRECAVVVQKYHNSYKDEMDNKVNGVKPIGSIETAGTIGLT
jgi:hypothetical protein